VRQIIAPAHQRVHGVAQRGEADLPGRGRQAGRQQAGRQAGGRAGRQAGRQAGRCGQDSGSAVRVGGRRIGRYSGRQAVRSLGRLSDILIVRVPARQDGRVARGPRPRRRLSRRPRLRLAPRPHSWSTFPAQAESAVSSQPAVRLCHLLSHLNGSLLSLQRLSHSSTALSRTCTRSPLARVSCARAPTSAVRHQLVCCRSVRSAVGAPPTNLRQRVHQLGPGPGTGPVPTPAVRVCWCV
jgi:hypothetical protein